MKKEWQKYYDFLEELKQSGVTNMFGAVLYLLEMFDIDRKLASEILVNWIYNYDEINGKV